MFLANSPRRSIIRRLASSLRPPRPNLSLSDKDHALMRLHGLTLSGRIEVPVRELHVQHRSEWPLDGFLVAPDGTPDRSIIHSPFRELLDLYREHGFAFIESHYRETSYYGYFRVASDVGYYVDWTDGSHKKQEFSDATILRKVHGFVRTYESIRRLGYRGSGHEQRSILVLDVPFEVQRFGMEINWDWRPFEIWSGHHRAAVLAALGFDKASVLLLKVGDPQPLGPA